MKKGISLIELMVVIIVLGILATLALPNIKNIADDARTAALNTDIATVQTAVDMYVLEGDNTNLPVFDVQPAGDTNPALIDFSLLAPDYLRTAPASAETVTFVQGSATTYGDEANAVIYAVGLSGIVTTYTDGADFVDALGDGLLD